MVLVQISVYGTTDGNNTANNGTYIPINIVGMYNIRITSLQYHQTGGAGDAFVRVIGIDNDKLRLPTSQYPYPIFMTNAQTNGFGFDTSKQYHFHNVDMDGRIFINVINTATGIAPTGFTNLVLTLDVDKC
jgi:hypothetical protein